MIPFHLFCPEVARNETRAVVVPEGNPELPAGTYAFMELYCAERGCPCNNVMVNVCDDRGVHLATINHSLSPGGFADLGVRDTFLDPLNTQSRCSNALLALFRRDAQDSEYATVLRRHRAMVMEVVNGKRGPALRGKDPAKAKRRERLPESGRRWTLRPSPPGEGRRREGPSPPGPGSGSDDPS